jgi:hypothetical protein
MPLGFPCKLVRLADTLQSSPCGKPAGSSARTTWSNKLSRRGQERIQQGASAGNRNKQVLKSQGTGWNVYTAACCHGAAVSAAAALVLPPPSSRHAQ